MNIKNNKVRDVNWLGKYIYVVGIFGCLFFDIGL